MSKTGTLNGTIRIFGAPGVETSLSLSSPSTPVKFLQFATNLFKLVCIGEKYSVYLAVDDPALIRCVDGNDKLYLWDLTPHGQIKLEASMRFDRPVTSV